MATAPLYDELVVVAEDEWKFHCDRRDAFIKFSAQLGGLEWDCGFKNHDTICLECRGLAVGTVKEVHIEVLLYCRQTDSLDYTQSTETAERRVLTADHPSWTYTIPSNYYQHILLTLRILKNRSAFPDFTLDNSAADHLASNGKLRVGPHLFHVNKQLLAWLSPFFDRMFNGKFVEAKQEEIKLGEEITNPRIFQDFLLTISPPGKHDVLPNRENVAELLHLAKYYQVELVRQKCERHLKLAREMPIEERIVLAKKYELKELQARIVHDVISLELCKRLCLSLLNADEYK